MAELQTADRRRLLQIAAAAALAAWGPRSAFSQPRLRDDPFTLGVASGAPGSSTVVLWTRLTGDGLGRDTVPVRWEIAHDEAFQRIAQHGVAPAPAELAHSVHVEAHGLEPDRWYFYRFAAGGWRSPIGRTRTLPAPDAMVARLRVAYASCQRWEHGYFGAYRQLRADQPDLVLFLGDYIYEYPGALSGVRGVTGFWVTSLDDYRQRHALYKSDRDLQALHAACPWLVTWDDHEVQNDYAGLAAGNSGPPWADFRARRAAAYQAYYEHMPLSASALTGAMQGLSGGAEMRLYSQFRYGRLAQIDLLDLRQYRAPQACTPRGRAGGGEIDPQGCEALADPRRSMLGAAQEQWLHAQLASGEAAWTVLAQGTLFGQCNLRAAPAHRIWNDGWDGYPAARRRLTDALQASGARNAVLLGGDVHQNWVGHVKQDYARPDSANVAVEFCGTSVTSRPRGSKADALPKLLQTNPHFVYADATHRGYGLADFTPARLQVQLRVADDVAKPDTAVRTLASFAVEAGRAQVERA
jgi:alkaline phosphatase D